MILLEVKVIVEVNEDDFDATTFEWFLDSLLRKEDVVAESIDACQIGGLCM